MAKSVLHIRIDSSGYNSNAIAKGFIDNGFDYDCIYWQQVRFNENLETLKQKVIQRASEIKPDIIFCHIQNPEIFDKQTWIELSKHGFVINYTFDVRYAKEIEWMYEIAPFIGFTFFGCMEDVDNCRRRGISNVGFCASSCDMDLFKPKNKNLYAFDIVFCGNNYERSNLNFPLASERQRMIELLNEKYPSTFMPYGLGQRGGMIPAETETNVYNFSRIAINQNNFSLRKYTSDRLWRIMASGTFCLTKYFPGLEEMFDKEIHLDWFNNFTEMVQLIDYYLSHDEERKEIALTGSNYVREFHTWTDRVFHMMEETKQLAI